MKEQTFINDLIKTFKRILIQFIIPPTIVFIIFLINTSIKPYIVYYPTYFFMCFLWICIRIGPIEFELYNIYLKIRIKYERLKSEGKNVEAEKYIKSIPGWVKRNCLIAEEKCRPIFW